MESGNIQNVVFRGSTPLRATTEKVRLVEEIISKIIGCKSLAGSIPVFSAYG